MQLTPNNEVQVEVMTKINKFNLKVTKFQSEFELGIVFGPNPNVTDNLHSQGTPVLERALILFILTHMKETKIDLIATSDTKVQTNSCNLLAAQSESTPIICNSRVSVSQTQEHHGGASPTPPPSSRRGTPETRYLLRAPH